MRRSAFWYGQRILHGVVGVPGRDIKRLGQIDVIDGGTVVGDAGGHELVRPDVLADDVRLPRDELRGELRLEGAPGQIVLGLSVAVRDPQVRPGGELV